MSNFQKKLNKFAIAVANTQIPTAAFAITIASDIPGLLKDLANQQQPDEISPISYIFMCAAAALGVYSIVKLVQEGGFKPIISAGQTCCSKRPPLSEQAIRNDYDSINNTAKPTRLAHSQFLQRRPKHAYNHGPINWRAENPWLYAFRELFKECMKGLFEISFPTMITGTLALSEVASVVRDNDNIQIRAELGGVGFFPIYAAFVYLFANVLQLIFQGAVFPAFYKVVTCVIPRFGQNLVEDPESSSVKSGSNVAAFNAGADDDDNRDIYPEAGRDNDTPSASNTGHIGGARGGDLEANPDDDGDDVVVRRSAGVK